MRRQPVYQATARVLLNSQDLVASSLIGVEAPPRDTARYAVTQAQLAVTPTVVRRALDAAGLRTTSVEGALGRTTVDPDADVLVFTVRDASAARAARLASELARQYTSFRRQLDTRELSRLLGSLEARLRQLEASGRGSSQLYTSLAASEQQIRLLEGLRQANVYVVRTPTAADAEQTGPAPLRDAGLGLVAGLLLGLVLVAVVHALDTRVVSADELRDALGLPLLGRVRSRRTDGAPTPESGDVVGLAAALRVAAERHGVRSMLLAGAMPGDLAGEDAGEVALALARAGSRVLLVDCDLRESRAGGWLGGAGMPGIADVAAGRRSVEDALVRVAVGSELASAGSLEALPSGTTPDRPAEFTGSGALIDAVAALRPRAELVLAVAPPLLTAPEALALAGAVDGLVLVVARGGVRREELSELLRLLEAVPVAKLGFAFVEREGRPRGRRLVRRPRETPSAGVAEGPGLARGGAS